MVRIPHTINLVTEVDENHPEAQRLLEYHNPPELLAELFKSILISEGFLDMLNAGGSYAIVKLDN